MTSSNENIFRVTSHLWGEFEPVTGEFPSQRPVTRSFDVFRLMYTWTNDKANHRDADDLRRHRAHYDVTVMIMNNQIPRTW